MHEREQSTEHDPISWNIQIKLKSLQENCEINIVKVQRWLLDK